jgi:hypothetical protein
MDISRRNFGLTLTSGSALTAFAAAPFLILEEGCSVSTADDITWIIGAANAALDIAVQWIPGGSALVGVGNAIASALTQVTAIWGNATTAVSAKWANMLTILEALPGQILTLSPELKAIIAGVSGLITILINLIKQLQSNTTVTATNQIKTATGVKGSVSVQTPAIPAANPRAISALLAAIRATQARLEKL